MTQIKKILLADDEVSLRRSMAFILEKAGYSVVHAENGVEAIFATQQEPIDLCIMDLKMRNVDGITATDSIYHLQPDLPVIVVSAFIGDILSLKLPPSVIKIYEKPIDIDQLIEFIKQL